MNTLATINEAAQLLNHKRSEGSIIINNADPGVPVQKRARVALAAMATLVSECRDIGLDAKMEIEKIEASYTSRGKFERNDILGCLTVDGRKHLDPDTESKRITESFSDLMDDDSVSFLSSIFALGFLLAGTVLTVAIPPAGLSLVAMGGTLSANVYLKFRRLDNPNAQIRDLKLRERLAELLIADWQQKGEVPTLTNAPDNRMLKEILRCAQERNMIVPVLEAPGAARPQHASRASRLGKLFGRKGPSADITVEQAVQAIERNEVSEATTNFNKSARRMAELAHELKNQTLKSAAESIQETLREADRVGTIVPDFAASFTRSAATTLTAVVKTLESVKALEDLGGLKQPGDVASLLTAANDNLKKDFDLARDMAATGPLTVIHEAAYRIDPAQARNFSQQ